MANMSFAIGTIEVKGIDEKDVAKFWKTFVRTQEYVCNGNLVNTCYGEFLDEPSDDENLKERVQRFTGCGRWALQNNLDSFGRWSKQELVNGNETEMLKWLEESDFALHFEYDECESGYGFLQHVSCDIVHIAGTPLEKCALLNEDVTDYDYNLYYLAKLDFEEVEEYLRNIEDFASDEEEAAELIEREFNRSLKSAKDDGADIDDVCALLDDFESFENTKGEKFDIRKSYKAILS